MESLQTLNLLDNSVAVLTEDNFRIIRTSSSVSLDFHCLLPIVVRSLLFIACIVFSLAVHHSRFSTRLSVLMPFLWFICSLLSGLGMNASATSLCRNLFSYLLSLHRRTLKYPFLSGEGFKIRSFFKYPCLPALDQRDKLITLPFSVIEYSPIKLSMPFMAQI